jgi:hypothetical protein
MDAAASDRCPRCGGAFHCGVNDTEPCACSTVQLDDELLTQLRRQYNGCLCMRCLVALSESAPGDTR